MKKLYGLLVFMALFVLVACGDDETDETETGVEYPVEYFNATVLSSEVDGDTVVLKLEGQGYHPVNLLKVTVTFVAGVMTEYVVTDHGESAEWGGIIIDEGELQAEIVEHADDLDAIDEASFFEHDEVAGGTVAGTVEGMVDTARAAVEHFNKYYAD